MPSMLALSVGMQSMRGRLSAPSVDSELIFVVGVFSRAACEFAHEACAFVRVESPEPLSFDEFDELLMDRVMQFVFVHMLIIPRHSPMSRLWAKDLSVCTTS